MYKTLIFPRESHMTGSVSGGIFDGGVILRVPRVVGCGDAASRRGGAGTEVGGGIKKTIPLKKKLVKG